MSEFFKTEKAFAISLGVLGIMVGWLFSLMVSSVRDIAEEQSDLIKKVEGLKADVEWVSGIVKDYESKKRQYE